MQDSIAIARQLPHTPEQLADSFKNNKNTNRVRRPRNAHNRKNCSVVPVKQRSNYTLSTSLELTPSSIDSIHDVQPSSTAAKRVTSPAIHKHSSSYPSKRTSITSMKKHRPTLVSKSFLADKSDDDMDFAAAERSSSSSSSDIHNDHADEDSTSDVKVSNLLCNVRESHFLLYSLHRRSHLLYIKRGVEVYFHLLQFFPSISLLLNQSAPSDSTDDTSFDSRSHVILVRTLWPQILLQPCGDSPFSEPVECKFEASAPSMNDKVEVHASSLSCWFPRERAAPENKSIRERSRVNLEHIDGKLLRPGFGSYLKRLHGEMDPNSAWTKDDTKKHNQRILVCARFVHYVCTQFGVSLPDNPESADKVLVNTIGDSRVFEQFVSAVSENAASSTVANHSQALIHASNYAKEQLSKQASCADQHVMVQSAHFIST